MQNVMIKEYRLWKTVTNKNTLRFKARNTSVMEKKNTLQQSLKHSENSYDVRKFSNLIKTSLLISLPSSSETQMVSFFSNNFIMSHNSQRPLCEHQ
jgi:hypothetical protein